MSQIATTFEQSKTLIGAGVPEDSADMMWCNVRCGKHDTVVVIPKYPDVPQWSIVYPAWSLSALWSIIHNLDKTYEFPTELSAEALIETLVTTICYRYELR